MKSMWYPSKKVEVVYRKQKPIVVDSCIMCGRYAEHFASGYETTKCRYCDFAYSEYVHYVILDGYGKIKSAGMKANKMILIGHALANHPEHFKKSK